MVLCVLQNRPFSPGRANTGLMELHPCEAHRLFFTSIISDVLCVLQKRPFPPGKSNDARFPHVSHCTMISNVSL